MIMYYCLIWIISILVVRFLIKKTTKTVRATTFRPPPSPMALPIIGHLHLLGPILPLSFQTLARRFGPIMQIRIGSSTFVVISSASIAKQVFKTHDINFASKFEFGPTEYNIYQGAGFITGPYGTYWRFMKKLCVTELFAGAQLERFNHIRQQEINNLVRSLMKKKNEGESCDLGVELAALANNLICKMTMSRKFSDNDGEKEAQEMRKLVLEIMSLAAKLGVNEVLGLLKKVDLFGNGKKVREALLRYDRVVEQIMKDYEDNEMKGGDDQERDLMDILLETYKDPDAEVKLTRANIKLFILELFMASIDTSSAAMQWAMAELINHPDAFKKLRDEIDSVVGSKRMVQESDVPNLPYLQAVVKESLRLNSPSPIIHRECIQDCKIDGYDVKAKTKTLVNAYAIMRDPETWQDPDEFVPERFLVNDGQREDQIKIKGQDFQYIPFGGGRRKCTGFAHAYIVMHSTIGALVQCFDWKIKGGDKIDINVGAGFTGANARPLECYPITHFDPFLGLE